MFKLLKTRPTALSMSTQTDSQTVGASSSLPDRLQSPTLPVHHVQTLYKQSNKSNSTHSRSLSQSATTFTLGKLSSSTVVSVPVPSSSPTSPISQESTAPIKQIKHRKAFSLSSSASVITFPDDYQVYKHNPNTLPIPVLSSLSSPVHNQASIRKSTQLVLLYPWARFENLAEFFFTNIKIYIYWFRSKTKPKVEFFFNHPPAMGTDNYMGSHIVVYIMFCCRLSEGSHIGTWKIGEICRGIGYWVSKGKRANGRSNRGIGKTWTYCRV